MFNNIYRIILLFFFCIASLSLWGKVEKVLVIKETSKGVLIEKANGEVWQIEIFGWVPLSAEGNYAIVEYSLDLDSPGSKILFKGEDYFKRIWDAEKFSDTPISHSYSTKELLYSPIDPILLIKIGLVGVGYLDKSRFNDNKFVINALKKYVADKKLKFAGKEPNNVIFISIINELLLLSKTNKKMSEFTASYISEVKKLYSVKTPFPSLNLSNGLVESTIDGDFNGWEGDTIVKLMDGSIWQQTDFKMSLSLSICPKVIIFNSGAQTKMKVEGNDAIVNVQRLK